MSQELLDIHCTSKGGTLMSAWDALSRLSSEDREVLIRAVRKDDTNIITNHMRKYRITLAERLNAIP